MPVAALVAVTAVVVGCAVAQPAVAAAPTGFTSAPRLAPAASFVAGKPIAVYCAKTQYDWQQYGATSREKGLAVPGSSEIKLAPDVCRYLRAPKVQDGFAGSLLVLVHEAIHARGTKDEGVTDCAAVHEMPRVAVKFFSVKAGKQLRAVMADAWTLRAREAPAYRTVC